MVLRDLPIGARVRDSQNPLVFRVASKNQPGYPGITMLADTIPCVGCFDAGEKRDVSRRIWEIVSDYGNNNYAMSNIHQWLNAEGTDWYQPSHDKDEPPLDTNLRYGEFPYAEAPGFLSGFSPTFRQGILETQVPVLERKGRNRGQLIHVPAKVFLPSRTEIVKGDESGFAEGAPLPLCYDPTVVHFVKPSPESMAKYGRSWNPPHEGSPLDSEHVFDPRFSWWYFLRTPSLQYKFMVRVMCAYGAVSYTYANNDSVGIRPMLNLDPDLPVEETVSLAVTETGPRYSIYTVVS